MNEQQGLLSPKLPKQAAAKQATTNAPAATAAPAVSTCLTRNTFDNGAVKFRGGALIVYDPLIDDRRRVRAHALLSSLNMLIETAGGFEYTAARRGRRGLWRCQYCPCRFPLTKRTRVNCCVSSSSRRRLWTLRPGVIPTDLVVCERWTRASTRRVRVRFRQLCDVARCWRGE